MGEITIRIPTPLRAYTGGSDEVTVEATTVREALAALGANHEGVLDPVGSVLQQLLHLKPGKFRADRKH